MPELESPEIMGQPPDEGLPYRAGNWFHRHLTPLLSVALALALVAVAALGTWLYLDHRDTRTEAEKGRVAAVQTWVDAVDSHDLGAVHGAMTTTPRILFLNSEGLAVAPIQGIEEVDELLTTLFARDTHLTVLRDPQVGEGSSQNQVWTLLHAKNKDDDLTDVHLFFVAPQDGVLKVDVVQVHV